MGPIKALETELTRQMIFWAAIELLGLIIGFWFLYVVIKCAIRDGINESRLGDSWTREVTRAKKEEPKL